MNHRRPERRAFITYFNESGRNIIVSKMDRPEGLDTIDGLSWEYPRPVVVPSPVEAADLLDDLEECYKMPQAIESEKGLSVLKFPKCSVAGTGRFTASNWRIIGYPFMNVKDYQ